MRTMVAPSKRRPWRSNLDNYTAQAKTSFDKRFGEVDSDGIYFSHQQIYGFRQGHVEPFVVNKYIPTYQILKSLSHLHFSSLLDVGEAEGHNAGLLSNLIGVKSTNSDLSSVAFKWNVQPYGIPSALADIMNLPFGDKELAFINSVLPLAANQ